MIILNVAGLSNKKYAGPNINVPACTLYEEEYAKTALYNTGKGSLENVNKLENYYMKDVMKNYDVKTLPRPFNNPDVVVFNSMYLIEHVKMANKLVKYGIPYVIIPRGALTEKAQCKKWYKKKIANLLFFNKYVNNASAIQFLTENEKVESSKFKYKKSIVCGNGVEEKSNHKEYGSCNDKFIITFIGRIEKFHKGLDKLMEAINQGQEELRKKNIILNLYGPDKNNSVSFLSEYIKKQKIEDLVKINKPVFDKEKEKILLESDLFVHTSRLEGHPTAVIEAISYGVPVLVTPGTNMYETVEENNLGFVADFNANEILKAIFKAYENKSNFKNISKNELEYSRKNFEWKYLVKKYIDNYKKMI